MVDSLNMVDLSANIDWSPTSGLRRRRLRHRLRPKHPRIVAAAAGVLGVVGVALVIWGVLAAGHGEMSEPTLTPTSSLTPTTTPRPVVQCGIKNSAPPGGRVENGQEVHPHHGYPWVGYIEYADGRFIGGATLINESFVVTDRWARPGMYVVLGAHNLSSTTEDTQRIMIDKIFQHPNSSSMSHGGIHLVRLSHPVNLTRNVSPICLADVADVLSPGSTCVIAGWGKDKRDPWTTDLLQEGSVTTITNQQCRYGWDGYPQLQKDITKDVICTAYAETRPSWFDRGGALMCRNNDIWSLHGDLFLASCCGRRPSLYHNVPESLPWINSVMSQ